MNTTAISTMIVEFTTSFLVGQAPLRSSPRTSEKNWVGLVRSLACAGAGLRRSGRFGWSEPCFWAIRRICRFCWFTASAFLGRIPGWSSLGSACRSRAGGTRTPNRRFWRPELCQIELLPSGRAGAGPRILAATNPRAHAGNRGRGPRRRRSAGEQAAAGAGSDHRRGGGGGDGGTAQRGTGHDGAPTREDPAGDPALPLRREGVQGL